MSLQFFIYDVNFEGTSNTLSQNISHTFPSDIKEGNVALQSINFNYDTSQRYIRTARMSVKEVQKEGPVMSCTVEVELHETNYPYEPIEQSSASVLFIADCE